MYHQQHLDHSLEAQQEDDYSTSSDQTHTGNISATTISSFRKKCRLTDSIRSITISPLVHETQSLQLCAIHALNNLLQLSAVQKMDDMTTIKHTCPTESSSTNNQQLILCRGLLFRHGYIKAASKAEFNSIADEVTRTEAMLFQDARAINETDAIVEANDYRQTRVSMWQVLTSHHRTPFLGNYSFEVLEAALLHRNVKLEWCTEMDSLISDDFIKLECNNSMCEFTIGYIFNVIEPLSIWNALVRPFTGSRHWYVVTNLRRVVDYKVKQKPDHCTGISVSVKNLNDLYAIDDFNSWCIIDSTSRNTVDFNHDDLKQFLYDVLQKGGSVMRARMSKLCPFK